MKKLPIGISDFKDLISQDYYYIDKTLFIKELIDSSGLVLLLPRPRRFGKTLNLSMLRYFFEKTDSDSDNSILFENTQIWNHEEYRKMQGKNPVIFLTFKDIKEESWESAYAKIKAIIAEQFNYHFSKLEKNISGFPLSKYKAIMEERADQVDYDRSLFFLSELLRETNNEQIIILIDEYDAPIHAGYNNGYYKEATQFMRSLLTSVLKDNNNLKRGILTGILRTAKEGIFSGLNNLIVSSLLDFRFQDKFGFTQPEVEQFLSDYNFSHALPDVQQWYNGYTFASTTIYNPWSLLMYVDNQGQLKPYWVNTSDNQIIKKLLVFSNSDLKTDMEYLLSGNTITKEIDEAIIFPGIEHNEDAIWSLLLFSGYVTYTRYTIERGKTCCILTIPNEEIKILYEGFIQEIIEGIVTKNKFNSFLLALTTGDVKTFAIVLQEFVLNSMSFYDFTKDEPEKSYHLFVLGLLVFLADKYQVKSNRESGYGRYDIMLIPHDKNKLGIIIEFKTIAKDSKETLEIIAQEALEQIHAKQYAQELQSLGIHHIKALGIAFQGKKLLVLDQDL